MPYIADEYRGELDKLLVPLAEEIKSAARRRALGKATTEVDRRALEHDHSIQSAATLEIAGFLNYACTRLTALVIPTPLKYSSVALFSGVLKNVSDEFYRRVAAPYENKQMRGNGDVYPPELIEGGERG